MTTRGKPKRCLQQHQDTSGTSLHVLPEVATRHMFDFPFECICCLRLFVVIVCPAYVVCLSWRCQRRLFDCHSLHTRFAVVLGCVFLCMCLDVALCLPNATLWCAYGSPMVVRCCHAAVVLRMCLMLSWCCRRVLFEFRLMVMCSWLFTVFCFSALVRWFLFGVPEKHLCDCHMTGIRCFMYVFLGLAFLRLFQVCFLMWPKASLLCAYDCHVFVLVVLNVVAPRLCVCVVLVFAEGVS